jgi:hypothetical protein
MVSKEAEMSSRLRWVVRGLFAGTVVVCMGLMGCQAKPETPPEEVPPKAEVKPLPPPPAPAPAPAPKAVTPAPTGGEQTYIVQKGDTLASIGRKFGVSWKKLQEANNLANPNLITPGQKIIIPAGGAPAGGGGLKATEPF